MMNSRHRPIRVRLGGVSLTLAPVRHINHCDVSF